MSDTWRDATTADMMLEALHSCRPRVADFSRKAASAGVACVRLTVAREEGVLGPEMNGTIDEILDLTEAFGMSDPYDPDRLAALFKKLGDMIGPFGFQVPPRPLFAYHLRGIADMTLPRTPSSPHAALKFLTCGRHDDEARHFEKRRMVILREVFGDESPVRGRLPPLPGYVRDIALAMRRQGDLSELPQLADLLEDHGVTEGEILDHLRRTALFRYTKNGYCFRCAGHGKTGDGRGCNACGASGNRRHAHLPACWALRDIIDGGTST